MKKIKSFYFYYYYPIFFLCTELDYLANNDEIKTFYQNLLK